jgi:ABC-type transport system involved in multi-copper enzyme maturation permease subunit
MIGLAEAPAIDTARTIPPPVWPLRWRVIPLIAQQELRDAVGGWSLYVAAALATLPGALLLSNAVRSVAESGLEVISRPFYDPLLVTTSLAALYLAAWAALAIARPRDQGALRVLFFAPVDATGLLAAQALSGLVLAGLFLLLTTPVFLVMSLLVNVPFPRLLLAGLLLSPALLAPAIGIGLFLSAIMPTARAAIFGLAAVLAALLVVQIGYSVLLQVPPTSRYYDALLFLRQALQSVRAAVHWLSPLTLLSDGLDAAVRGSWRELALDVASSLVGGVIWLALAAAALARRGVLP